MNGVLVFLIMKLNPNKCYVTQTMQIIS